MFTAVWAQLPEAGAPAPESPPNVLLTFFCLVLPLFAMMAAYFIMAFRGQRRSQAYLRESSERAERSEVREEHMVELLESIERELRQLNARQAGAGREPLRPPTDTAVRPPGQP